MMTDSNRFQLLRAPAVAQLTGLSVSSIYAAMAEGRFPKPIKTGANSVAWLSPEIDAWIDARLAHPSLAPKQIEYMSIVPKGEGLFRRADVIALTGKSAASLYTEIKLKNFPAPVSLINNTKAFLASEIFDWIQARVNERNHRLEQHQEVAA